MILAMRARCARWMAVVVVGVVMFGCAGSNTPARPAGLPSEAFWIGGADGGVFVRLAPSDATAADYSGAIYHPDGSVWYEGRFRLEPIGTAPLDANDYQRLTGWDGTQILLDDGRALVADEN
jgi:hypothetical protein